MKNSTKTSVISLLSGTIPSKPDWTAIYDLANQHGVAAYLWDRLEPQINDGTIEMPKALMLKWAGTAVAYEQRYTKYEMAISKLAQFYAKHVIKLMILKGYGLSLNYPVPNHRPCGDIDTYNFGEYKRADELLTKETGIKVDNTHHHHTVFSIGGFSVENHYDFQNIHSHKSNAEIEVRLHETLEPCEKSQLKYGGEVYFPSAQFNALFLISHAGMHFASGEMNLRQLLDWAYFVQKDSLKIDWGALQADCTKWGKIKYLDALNAICVDYLGFKSEDFPISSRDDALRDRVLGDILQPEFSEEAPGGFFKTIAWKYRRWRANAWKNAICYPEKPFPTFMRQVWSHLLKPSSITSV